MPPKKAAKKPKKVEAVQEDVNAPEALEKAAKAALIEQLKSRKNEVLQEMKQISEAQQTKSKLENFWTMGKQQLGDLRMELRSEFRQRQDLQEKQQYEIKVYRQKVKHLLHEQQTHVTDMRTEAEVTLSLLQEADRQSEFEVKRDNRAIAQMVREKEVGLLDLVKDIKLQQEKSIMALRQEFERRADEMKQSYEKKMKTVRKDFAKQRKVDVRKIEARKNSHISKLMVNHKEEFSDIKNYFTDVTRNNLDLIHQLKDEVVDMRRNESKDEKNMMEIATANTKLSEPLKKLLKDVEELRTELKNYQKDKLSLKQTKDRVQLIDDNMKNLSWEHEILQQRYLKAKEERDQIFDRLERAVYDNQQRAGFKELLLEKSVAAMRDTLEKKETAMHEVILSTNLQPEVVGDVSRNLDNVLQEKSKLVSQYEDKLREWREAYSSVIRTYESKLDEFGIPASEVGFEPKMV